MGTDKDVQHTRSWITLPPMIEEQVPITIPISSTTMRPNNELPIKIISWEVKRRVSEVKTPVSGEFELDKISEFAINIVNASYTLQSRHLRPFEMQICSSCML